MTQTDYMQNHNLRTDNIVTLGDLRRKFKDMPDDTIVMASDETGHEGYGTVTLQPLDYEETFENRTLPDTYGIVPMTVTDPVFRTDFNVVAILHGYDTSDNRFSTDDIAGAVARKEDTDLFNYMLDSTAVVPKPDQQSVDEYIKYFNRRQLDPLTRAKLNLADRIKERYAKKPDTQAELLNMLDNVHDDSQVHAIKQLVRSRYGLK